MTSVFVTSRRLMAALALSAGVASAQSSAAGSSAVGATLTPYAGYLITGNWYDGPVGTSISTTNAPTVGVQGSIPLARGISLVGNLAYASGDLRIGLPLLGGVNVGAWCGRLCPSACRDRCDEEGGYEDKLGDAALHDVSSISECRLPG